MKQTIRLHSTWWLMVWKRSVFTCITCSRDRLLFLSSVILLCKSITESKLPLDCSNFSLRSNTRASSLRIFSCLASCCFCSLSCAAWSSWLAYASVWAALQVGSSVSTFSPWVEHILYPNLPRSLGRTRIALRLLPPFGSAITNAINDRVLPRTSN